jgi:hypothetical protein
MFCSDDDNRMWDWMLLFSRPARRLLGFRTRRC